MGTTITVSTVQGLIAALDQAKGGETIRLAPGNYGKLALVDKDGFDLDFPSNVTIAAANPASPPVFSGFDLRGASNVTFDGLIFDYTFKPGDTVMTTPFRISGGENITIRNATFDGDLAEGISTVSDGYAAGNGLLVRGVQGLTIVDSEFDGFFRGLAVHDSADVLIRGNDLHSMRKDGMNFSQVERIVIENNRLHDFAKAPDSSDHRDMIQFWTTATTKPSSNIVIRNNTLDIGEGNATQSIFMRNDMVDQGLAGKDMFYRNVLIEGNVIVNGHLHGITVGETAGLVIRSNSVLHADGDQPDGRDPAVEIPRINVSSASTGVTITQNATAAITGFTGQAGWTVTKNAIVQDQNAFAPGYYGEVFVSSSLQRTAEGTHVFVAREGGLLDQMDAGAPRAPNAAPGTIDAAIQVKAPPQGSQTISLDATVTIGDQPAGTTYLWNFGDGTVAEGKTVTHTYAKGGQYEVTLKVTTPAGATCTETMKVGVDGCELLRLDDSGRFVAASFGHETALARPEKMTAEGLQLGGPGVAAGIDRSHLEKLFATDDVTMRLVLEADRAGTSGEVARLHGSFVLSVNSRGELVLRAWSTAGDAVTLVSAGKAVNRGAEHEIEVRLDSGRLSLWVDGVRAAETGFDGRFADRNELDLTFGNAWGRANFRGDLAGFEIDLNDGAYHPGFDAAVTDRFATLSGNDLLF
jgi:hypothetical protein